jgi:hypothetical protein
MRIFIQFFTDKDYSKFCISYTLGLIFLKSYSLSTFQQYQKSGPIPLKLLVLILLDFQRQICSIFNNFCIIDLNIW